MYRVRLSEPTRVCQRGRPRQDYQGYQDYQDLLCVIGDNLEYYVSSLCGRPMVVPTQANEE